MPLASPATMVGLDAAGADAPDAAGTVAAVTLCGPPRDQHDHEGGHTIGMGPPALSAAADRGLGTWRASLVGRHLGQLAHARTDVSHDPVAEAIRKELWRQTGHRVDTAEIVRLLSETLLRPSGLQG